MVLLFPSTYFVVFELIVSIVLKSKYNMTYILQKKKQKQLNNSLRVCFEKNNIILNNKIGVKGQYDLKLCFIVFLLRFIFIHCYLKLVKDKMFLAVFIVLVKYVGF